MSLIAGFGGATRNACAALCDDRRVLGVCEQERITRVRGAGANRTGLPDESFDELLRRAGRVRSDVSRYVVAEEGVETAGIDAARLDHHFAHACAAFLPSSFESATIVVCDHEPPQVSVWDGVGGTITRVAWPWNGPAFSEVYSRCATALGFTGSGHEQRMEAMARLDPAHSDGRLTRLLRLDVDRLELAATWLSDIAGSPGNTPERAVAAAVQSRIGDLLIELLAEVKRRAPARRELCVGGSLFYNGHFNARMRQCREFDEVFIPINPGNAGLAVGAALHAGGYRQRVTPFLGPSYTPDETKATLDNCKLTYDWVSEEDTIGIAVDAIQKGQLVAWFEGPMEWGPRALGARSIIASPFAPYVLDNLNRFLKRRDPWRGYSLSGVDTAIREYFDGPASSPFMECDFTPRDRGRFRHILPGPQASVRIHTVDSDAQPRFGALLRAFGDATGIPIVVNTSFNGFREPIVCSPRDAVRVFFGTGIDTLVLDRFVIRK